MVTKKGLSLYMAIATVALACAALFLPSHVFAQKMFPSPEAATEALVDALTKNDAKALRAVLGENWKRFIPTEGIERGDVDAFLTEWQKSHSIEPDTDGRVHLAVGRTNGPSRSRSSKREMPGASTSRPGRRR